MGINDKNNNAYGKDPDYGAIFMSNSETKRECFKRGLFGLPSSDIQFVEQIKTGMILFLFEYEKRQLHGVFKASCDGAINIVPNAFAKVGKQFPAQVKFDAIWLCKPLPEKLFRDAIRENYFTSNKFNFGLSENQVHELLYLFNERRLEPEASPGRLLSSNEDLKSEWYSLGKVGRSVDHGMCIERLQNEQDVGGSISAIKMPNRQGDSLLYNGEYKYTGLNASDIKQGRTAQFSVDTTTSEYVSDYLGLKNESRFAAYENEDYMDICLRPNFIGGYSKSPSDKIRNHGEGRLSIRDGLMSKSLPETDQRILFSNDIPGLNNSDVNPSGFYSKHILEHNPLVQNRLRPTSTMIHPIQSQILNNTGVTQRDTNSNSNSLLCDPDAPGLNFSRVSSAGINDGSKPIMESTSPSNNYGRKSLSSQPCLIRKELKDTSRWHTAGGDLQNSVFYSSNRDYMPLNTVQNSDQLAAESVVYEACDIPSLSPSIPPPDIGRSSSLHDPFSSLLHIHQSWLGNNFHSTTLQENLSHDITLPKNYDTYTPEISWANEGHFKDGDSLIHEYDIGCGSQNNNSGYPKKKSSVFSRLSFMQDSKQENGNNVRNEGYDFHTSVDAVMERVRLNHNKWMKKRKPKPMHNKAESLKYKTQISSSRKKEGDCFENALTNQTMDLSTATEGNAKETAEETCFVDFKHRSKVRKLSDENEIRSSNESEKNENLVFGQQKKRKLIRPNFSKSITSDDKGIDLSASQNLQVPSSLGSYTVKDVKESCCVFVQTADNIKADAEVRNIISETHSEKSSHARGYACIEGGERAADSALAAFNVKSNAEVQNIHRTHSEDKNNSSRARGYGCGEGGEKAINGALTALNDGSKCLDNISQNVFASASCKDVQNGLCSMDSIKSASLNTGSLRSIRQCQENHAHKIICAGRGINTDKEMPKDCSSSFKDGSEYLKNSGNEKAPIETSCPMKEGLLVMNSIKSASAGKNSLHSICQEHLTGKIICTGRGNNTKQEMSKDGDYFAGVKDGFDCLQNSNNDNASIATSCFQEGLCMTDSKKSLSQSLPWIPQECNVGKVRCAGRVTKTEERMLKVGRSPISTEVQDGSDSCQNPGNEDNAPITPCELHKMA